MNPATPVFFELEPIGENGALEANGRIHYFCSVTCRNRFDGDATDYKPGQDVDYLPGTSCETCGWEVGYLDEPRPCRHGLVSGCDACDKVVEPREKE